VHFKLTNFTYGVTKFEVIFVPLGEEIALERGHQRGVPPPLEIVILPLWVRLA